jgi:hypothetical protein
MRSRFVSDSSMGFSMSVQVGELMVDPQRVDDAGEETVPSKYI